MQFQKKYLNWREKADFYQIVLYLSCNWLLVFEGREGGVIYIIQNQPFIKLSWMTRIMSSMFGNLLSYLYLFLPLTFSLLSHYLIPLLRFSNLKRIVSLSIGSPIRWLALEAGHRICIFFVRKNWKFEIAKGLDAFLGAEVLRLSSQYQFCQFLFGTLKKHLNLWPLGWGINNFCFRTVYVFGWNHL